MSPGATMERVYIELKARAMRGEFAPGERLDPAVLARNLEVSATPVRDALHRLSGERIIDSRSEEHTSELQSLMRISYAVFCLKKKNETVTNTGNIKSMS